MYDEKYIRVTVTTANVARTNKVTVFTKNRDTGDIEPYNMAKHGNIAYCQGLFILTEELPKLDNKWE